METTAWAAGRIADGPQRSALAVDPQGRLWVGYFDRGLDIVEGTNHSMRATWKTITFSV